MRPRFHPRLINGPNDDPGLYVPFLFENRAIIFDLGDTHPLSTRDLLNISHAFITHTHIDHFIGFDVSNNKVGFSKYYECSGCTKD